MEQEKLFFDPVLNIPWIEHMMFINFNAELAPIFCRR